MSLVLPIYLLMCFLVKDALQCDKVNFEMSTPLTTKDDSPMTYVGDGNATLIRCNFSCDDCERTLLVWRKDNEAVYIKTWSGSGTGPTAKYMDKVREHLHVDDDVEGVYVLEWISTRYDDCLDGQNFTNWECYIRTDTCDGDANGANIDYYRYPNLELYVAGNIVKDFSDVEDIESEKVECRVVSSPASQLQLFQGSDEVTPDESSCSPTNDSEYEFVCSISKSDLAVNQGFECKVFYESPETGETDEVIPEGCCYRGLYPENLPGTLSAGEVAAIVISVLVVCGGIAGIAYYGYKKKKDKRDQLRKNEPTGERDQPSENKPTGKRDQPHKNEPTDERNQPRKKEPIGERDQPRKNEPTDERNQPRKKEPIGEQDQPRKKETVNTNDHPQDTSEPVATENYENIEI